MTHRYQAACSWKGSTGAGYDHYGRAHRVTASPAPEPLEMSADPAFLGTAEHVNPEQLLLMAATSCQLLSFLAVSARARIDVIGYEDRAEAAMPEADQPTRITDIWLRPHITIRAPATEPQARHLVEVAHQECFIANTLNCRNTIEPAVQIVDTTL